MAAIWAAVIAAGSGIASGKSQSNTSKKSAAAQSAAYQKAYKEAQSRLSPYSDFGRGALSNLGRLTGNTIGFSSKESDELASLKSSLSEMQHPSPPSKSGTKWDLHRKRKYNERMNSYERDLSSYNQSKASTEARIAELEPIVAQQQAKEAANPQTTGADYLRELPGYQFRLDEGNRGVGAAQSRRNMALSGAAQKELAKYNQDFASTEYEKEFGRLYQMAGLGQNTDIGLANLSMGFGAANAAIAQGLGQDQATTAASYNNAVQSGLANYQYAKNKNNTTNNNPNSAYSQQQYGPSDIPEDTQTDPSTGGAWGM